MSALAWRRVTGRSRQRWSVNLARLVAGFVVGLLTLPGAAFAQSFSTTFPTAEVPLSENGTWIDGDVTGLDWASVEVSPAGLAHGTQSGGESGPAVYADSTAVLSGDWSPKQTAMGVVHTTNQQSGNIFEEVELRLRTTITAHSITGYECNYAARKKNPYVQIVRWNGPLGDFTALDARTGPGLRNGDVVKCSIDGGTITTYVNNVEIFHVTDPTYASGSPGIGFYFQTDGSHTALNTDFGFTSFMAFGEQAATTTALTSSANPSTGGAPVTFTATVTGVNPTGTVRFMDGQAQLASVSLVGGVATVTTTELTRGWHQISATYSGDGNNPPSTSSTIRQRVR
jgi:hypothetical protein